MGDVEAEAPEEKAERLGDTICDVDTEALLVTLAEMPLEGKAAS